MALFAEKGYTATATREICQKAGVTKPVLYYHFKNKEDLYRVLLLESIAEEQRELTAASYRGATARQKLVDVMSADFSLTKRNPRLSTMVYRMVFAPQKEIPAIDYVQMGLEWVNLMEGVLREGVRRGELACHPRQVAEALLGVHMLYSLSYLVRGEPDLDRRLASRIVHLLVGNNKTECTDR